MTRRPDAQLRASEVALDTWLRRLTIAVNRVRHYRRRITTLQRRARQHRPAGVARAIRLR